MEKKKPSWFLKTFDPRMWFYDFGKWTAALFIWLWLRTKRIFVDGKKVKGFSRGRYIIATNHVSLYDHFVVASALANRRICNVATTKLKKGPFGWFFTAAGTIFIDEEHLSVKAIKQVTDTLDRGHIVCMYPEGFVSKDEDIKNFKGGVAMMSAISQADILPIYLPKSKNIWHRRVAVIGSKIKYEDLFKTKVPTKDEINRVSELLMEKELALENRYKELLNKRAK